MGMIDPEELDLEGSEEPYAVKPGEEYKLVIVDVNEGEDKNDLAYAMPKLEVMGEPYAKDFSYFLHIPDKKKMSEKQLNRVRWNYKTFCQCFGIDTTRPFNMKDDWPGHEGWCILGAEESDQYGEQNFIKKLIAPK